MSKQIVVKFHKPTDDFYGCIEKFGYMLMEALNFNLKMRAYETEVLKNPRDYVKEERVQKLLIDHHTELSSIWQANNDFPYPDYNLKIEYDEGFFPFTELKDITVRDTEHLVYFNEDIYKLLLPTENTQGVIV